MINMATFIAKCLDWLIQFNDFHKLCEAQPTYVLSQAVFILAGIITLIHAINKGGRWPYFWFATVLHGIYADNFWHFVLPDYDNFWHSQTTIIFLDARLPLHIIFLYPAFIYHAAYAVSQLNLSRCIEPFAVGLVTLLIDIPYDIVAVKFVHWTWHDTDPNIYDRHYWVPWNSYYFHCTFTASFFFAFHALRSAPRIKKWESAGLRCEIKALILSVLLGMPGGVLMFLPIYHPLHDIYGIHSEVTFFVLFALFGVIVLFGLFSYREKPRERLNIYDYLLLAQLALHYLLYWSFVVFFHPEREWSFGLHEKVGPCNEIATLTSVFGQTLRKRKYLCLKDYDEGYFDFKCLNESKPKNGYDWYKICGTPFENRAEYIVLLSTILLFAGGVFYGIYFQTRKSPSKEEKKQKFK